MRDLLWIFVMAGVIIAVVAVTNWMPSSMQKGFARQYISIEEARRILGAGYISLPTYFPEGITWPPTLIIAQSKPYKAIAMEFKKAGTVETTLIIIEASEQGNDVQFQRIRLSELREQTQFRLKGKEVRLQVGTCDNRKPCSRLTWRDNGLHYTVLLVSSPFEVMKIAESLIH
ncbi:MAG: hypothetical protein ACLPX5_05095 [Dissulfurispiraceae bacterium]